MRLPVSYLKGNAPDEGRRAQRRKGVTATTTKMRAISRQEKGKKSIGRSMYFYRITLLRRVVFVSKVLI